MLFSYELQKRKSEDTSVSPPAKKSKANPVRATRGRAAAKQQAEPARPRVRRARQR